MMHFPPVSDFPLFSKNFKTLWKIYKIIPFPKKISDFHPPKFLMTFFLVIEILNFLPILPVLVHSPLIDENYYFPLLSQISPLFSENSPAFYILSLNFLPILPVLVHSPLIDENYYFPLLSQISPLFSENSPAFYILSVDFPPTLTMMHLCITQCTYWTPLYRPIFKDRPYPTQFSFGYVPFNITCAINVPCRLSL